MIIIMAQGQQRRLSALGYPKQLIEVRGVPIIKRTISQNSIVSDVVCGHDLMRQITGDARYHTLAEPGDCILDGIAGSQLLWGWGRTTILLGDVYYSNAAMDAIMADDREIMFAGTSDLSSKDGEIFAMSFARSYQRTLVKLLAAAPCRQVEYSGIGQAGHLRELLWAVQSREVAPQVVPPGQHWAPAVYLPIDDETMDFDTLEDIDRAKVRLG